MPITIIQGSNYGRGLGAPGNVPGTWPNEDPIETGDDSVPNFAVSPNIFSVQTGNWSSSSTWDLGRVPQAGDTVGIKLGHTVTYDVNSAAEILAVGIAGTLSFNTSINTKLCAQNILVYRGGGHLQIGTLGSPVASDKTAEIVINDAALIDSAGGQYSNGLLVWGKITVHGMIKTPFVRPVTEPSSGNASIQLGTVPTGWQNGDQLYIADSRGGDNVPDQIEKPTIASMSSATVTFNSGLSHNHPGMRNYQNTLERTPHIGNLTRNVIIRSEALPTKVSGSITGATNASPIVITSTNHQVLTGMNVYITGVGGNTAANGFREATKIDANTFSIAVAGNGTYTSGGTYDTWEVGVRGHVQFFDVAEVSVKYAEFRNLGRTKVNLLNASTNHVGRYALHIHHLTGPPDTGQTYQYELVGNVIQDTGNHTLYLQSQGFSYLSTRTIKWGITVHDSHWGLIQGNIVRGYAGWGIGTEEGNETENVFDGNWVGECTGLNNGFGREDDRELGNPKEWGHTGSGFWLAGPNNRVINNVVTNTSPKSYSPYNIRSGGPVTIPNTQGVSPDVDGTVKNLYDITLLQWNNNEAYGSVYDGNSPWYIGADTENVQSSVVGESIIDNDCHWGVTHLGFFLYPSRNLTIRNCIVRGGTGSTSTVWGFGPVDYTQCGGKIINPDIQLCDYGIGVPTKQRNQSGTNGDMFVDGGFLANKNNFYVGIQFGNSHVYEPRNFTVTDTECIEWTGRGTPTYDVYMDFPASGSPSTDYTVGPVYGNPVMPDTFELVDVSLNGDVVSGIVYHNNAQEPASLVPVIADDITGSITGATNANPIVITSNYHQVYNNVHVTITGVGGNTAANGKFIATRLGLHTFSIPIAGNGTYTSGGTWAITRGQPSATKSNTDSLAQDGYCICGAITPGTAATHTRIRNGKLDEV